MLDPPLQHALFHTSKDFRERHPVQTVCGLTWESWDVPMLDEVSHTNCLLCWRGGMSIYAPAKFRIVRGHLVEVYRDRRPA